MNARNQFLLKALLSLVALWIVVFTVIKVAGSMKPTPEKIRDYAEKNPLSEIEDKAERKKVIGNLADMLNQLEPDQFKEFADRGERENEGREAQDLFFSQMDAEEQMFFMEKRIGKAFHQMMKAFNEMDRDQRRKIVERSLKQMQNNPGRGPAGERLEEVDPEMVEKITNAGLKAYYQDASAETKLDLAPLMEEMQNTMGRFGGRPR